eukprot:Hpha_TRINITY_DN12005_c0_g2::TRINITY_DN12005_c0_g2_i1::g.141004::m.141004
MGEGRAKKGRRESVITIQRAARCWLSRRRRQARAEAVAEASRVRLDEEKDVFGFRAELVRLTKAAASLVDSSSGGTEWSSCPSGEHAADRAPRIMAIATGETRRAPLPTQGKSAHQKRKDEGPWLRDL